MSGRLEQFRTERERLNERVLATATLTTVSRGSGARTDRIATPAHPEKAGRNARAA